MMITAAPWRSRDASRRSSTALALKFVAAVLVMAAGYVALLGDGQTLAGSGWNSDLGAREREDETYNPSWGGEGGGRVAHRKLLQEGGDDENPFAHSGTKSRDVIDSNLVKATMGENKPG